MDAMIETTSITRSYATAEDVLLDETKTTRLIFRPAIYNKETSDEISHGGARGELIRFKKNADDKWEELPRDDFRRLKVNEGTYIELSTDALAKLVERANVMANITSHGKGKHSYAVIELENPSYVTNNTAEFMRRLLQQGNRDAIIETCLQSGNSEFLEQFLDVAMIHKRKIVLADLIDRLQGEFHETKGPDSWQQWILQNSWVLGVKYKKPIPGKSVSVLNLKPDYLFPTMDGFIDVLEIKLPKFKVIEEDPNHPGSWAWSRETNWAIGQVANYLKQIEMHSLILEKNLGFSFLKPRAFILIGTEEGWTVPQKEALRNLNNTQHGIEVITYTELVRRAMAQCDFIESTE